MSAQSGKKAVGNNNSEDDQSAKGEAPKAKTSFQQLSFEMIFTLSVMHVKSKHRLSPQHRLSQQSGKKSVCNNNVADDHSVSVMTHKTKTSPEQLSFEMIFTPSVTHVKS